MRSRFEPGLSIGELWDASGQGRIGSSYGDGVQALVDRVTSVTGVPIDHYVELDFPGIRQVVDIVGGLPLALL